MGHMTSGGRGDEVAWMVWRGSVPVLLKMFTKVNTGRRHREKVNGKNPC